MEGTGDPSLLLMKRNGEVSALLLCFLPDYNCDGGSHSSFTTATSKQLPEVSLVSTDLWRACDVRRKPVLPVYPQPAASGSRKCWKHHGCISNDISKVYIITSQDCFAPAILLKDRKAISQKNTQGTLRTVVSLAALSWLPPCPGWVMALPSPALCGFGEELEVSLAGCSEYSGQGHCARLCELPVRWMVLGQQHCF